MFAMKDNSQGSRTAMLTVYIIMQKHRKRLGLFTHAIKTA